MTAPMFGGSSATTTPVNPAVGTMFGPPVTPESVLQPVMHRVAGVEIPHQQFVQGLQSYIAERAAREGYTLPQDLAGAVVHGTIQAGKDIAAFTRHVAGETLLGGGGAAGVPTVAGRAVASTVNLLRQQSEEEDVRSAQRGGALLGTIALDAVIGPAALAVARPFLAATGTAMAGGALYGLTAPLEPDQTVGQAVANSAAGFGLLGGGTSLLAAKPFTLARQIRELNEVAPAAADGVIARAREAPTGAIATEDLKLRTSNGEPVNLGFRKFTTEDLPQAMQDEGVVVTPDGDILVRGERAKAAQEAQVKMAIDGITHANEIKAAKEALGFQPKDNTPVFVPMSERARFGFPERGEITHKQYMDAIRKFPRDDFPTPQAAVDHQDIASGAHGGAQAAYIEQRLAVDAGEGIPPELAGRLRVVESPRDLNPLDAQLAPVHILAKYHPIVGEVVQDAIVRREQATVIVSEWKALIKHTNKVLPAKAERVELGNLLDQYIRGEDLPPETPVKLAEAFGLWRQKLSNDRIELQRIGNKPPDWGIDAYFMHVFAGDWRVVTEGGEAIPGFIQASHADALKVAQDYLVKHPDSALRVEPNTMLWQDDAATALSPKAYYRFLGQAKEALGLGRAEVEDLVREGKVARPNFRQKFFGNALQRKVNLPGYEPDPVKAAAIYAPRFARKIAYNDFVNRATARLSDVPPELGNLRAYMKDWVQRVNGTPTAFEQQWNGWVRNLLAELPAQARIVGETQLSLGALSAQARRVETAFRLGYAPVSAALNYSQTWMNTASVAGFGNVLKAHKVLADAHFGTNTALAKEVDGILRQMGVEYSVPLGASQVYRAVGNVPMWHPLYLFNKAETVNRSLAALTGYQQAITRGATREQAIAEGRALMDRTQFIYSMEDLPKLLTGPVMQAVGQFKPFLVNELYFIAGLRGAEIPRFLVTTTAAGGVAALLAVPPLMLANMARKWLTGESFTDRAEKAFPKLARGLPGLTGIAVGQNVALGSQNTILDMNAGPVLNDLWALAQLGFDATIAKPLSAGNGSLTHEERIRLARQLLPNMVRRMMDAYHVARTGVVVQPTSGRPIFTPTSPMTEAMLTAIGARSVERSEADRQAASIGAIEQRQNFLRGQYLDRIVAARANGNYDDASRLRSEARDRHGLAISSDMIHAAEASQRRSVLDQRMRQVPKKDRRSIQERLGITR